MTYLSALSKMIDEQPGSSAGLWTHTPVDYAGNQDVANPQLTPPAGWPQNAFMDVNDAGARPPITDVPPQLVLPPAPITAGTAVMPIASSTPAVRTVGGTAAARRRSVLYSWAPSLKPIDKLQF